MKKWLYIVAFVILAKPVMPVVDYIVNYEYVSKVLCVNKAKPMMHCNGKCHLMKELAKASENEKPISSDKKSAAQESETLFFQAIPAIEFQGFSAESVREMNCGYVNFYRPTNGDSVFHPPTPVS